jgi:hypothetical protein
MTKTSVLSAEEVDHVLQQGYLVRRGAIPTEVVDRARRAINADLGKNGLPPDQLPHFRVQSFCPDLRDQPPVTDLINHDSVQAVLDDLIGLETVKPAWGGQIALRFPQPLDDGRDARVRETFAQKPGYHIDGTPSPGNGVPPGEVHNFAMLVGVLVNDQPTDFRGNFTLWPGSHLEIAKWFRENGVEKLADTGVPKVVSAEPLQITGNAGDVVFVHHLLAHGIAPNLFGDVRYNCFFRVWPKARGRYSAAALTDPWAEWKIGPA